MRSLPEGLIHSNLGSLSDGHIEFNAWYDGRIVAPNLPISEWSQTFMSGSQVGGKTQLTVVDPSGELAPWGLDDPLGVGGAMIQTRLVLGNAFVNLGWQRITDSAPSESWYRAGSGEWASGGATIVVGAEDQTVGVKGYNFISPESPPSGNTCINEIRRLLRGIMPMTFDGEVEDAPVPAGTTYRQDRMTAVEDLIAAMGCAYRVSGQGALTIYKPNTTSVWTVQGADLMGSLISVSRSQSIDTLKNVIVAQNTLEGGAEIQAYAEETSGPLRASGPHGRWVEFVKDDFATNQYEIQNAAYHALNSALRARVVSIPLTTAFHPGLEVGDWITVMMPITVGTEIPLQGRVTSISYGGPQIPVKMSVTIQADLLAVQGLSESLRAQRWSE